MSYYCQTCQFNYEGAYAGPEGPICPVCLTPILSKTQRKHLSKKRYRAGRIKRRDCTLEVIAKRDDYLCHICGQPVDMDKGPSDPYRPSRDHLKPVVDGGKGTPDNLKLAHQICNSRRGNALMKSRLRAEEEFYG